MDSLRVKPAFNKNNIAVVLSADGNYVPYLAVTIKSIFDNADPKYNYDVLVFDDGIKDHQKSMMELMVKSNCSIRYINVKELLKDVDTSLFQARGIWSIATFYRLFIPQVMSNYERVLYLDCDILVKDSLIELFKLDMKNAQVACVCDCLEYTKDKNRIRDCEKGLGLKDHRKYFNAGVVLFNISKIKYDDFKKRFFDVLQNYKLPFLDQDILNIIFEGKCKLIDLEWNYQYHLLNTNPNLREFKKIDDADKNPKIIHYTTGCKPWGHPELAHSYEWWQVARTVPFYEEIIFRNTQISDLLLRNVVKYKSLILKYSLSKLLRIASFGKFNRKISANCNKLHNQVKAVRAVFNGK